MNHNFVFFCKIKILNENLDEIYKTQQELEKRFAEKAESGNHDLNAITQSLKSQTHTFSRAFKQNPLSNDVFQKIEVDRF